MSCFFLCVTGFLGVHGLLCRRLLDRFFIFIFLLGNIPILSTMREREREREGERERARKKAVFVCVCVCVFVWGSVVGEAGKEAVIVLHRGSGSAW